MSKRPDDALPPWLGNNDAFKAWTIAELDKADAAFDQQMAKGMADLVRMLAMRTPEAADFRRKLGLSPFPRSKAESLKRHLTIGKRAAAEHNELLEQRAIEEGDIEALRRLHPRLARFLNLPPQRGRPKKIDRDPWSRQKRLADAIAELPRIRAIWEKNYGRSRRPPNAITAAQIAAERWGVSEDDLKRGLPTKSRR
jgi:hypothetical protein